ncbi:hypothetical protein QJS04_geneDACA003109 [Acorus gramineus]|uniref:Uncharacterized protein n=2 Tax=Acorus TaxID=4464 RepID=A0AAV9DBL7_ACOCL|nr:hypothetical protein QJS04_geneDACA003109 [Acorus gramineus]KAK1298630.1 hypothetical protein QJS10_CPB14g00426 [Acorus calamus]
MVREVMKVGEDGIFGGGPVALFWVALVALCFIVVAVFSCADGAPKDRSPATDAAGYGAGCAAECGAGCGA